MGAIAHPLQGKAGAGAVACESIVPAGVGDRVPHRVVQAEQQVDANEHGVGDVPPALQRFSSASPYRSPNGTTSCPGSVTARLFVVTENSPTEVTEKGTTCGGA
jgi:hypothetical protein